MTLFELSEKYKHFEQIIEDENADEQAVSDTLEALCGAIDEKLEAVGIVLKTLKVEADALKAEEKKLAARRAAKENHIRTLKEYLLVSMNELSRDRFETPKTAISVCSTKAVKIADESKLIEWLLKNRDDMLVYNTPGIDKRLLKEALMDGGEIPFAGIENRKYLRIK